MINDERLKQLIELADLRSDTPDIADALRELQRRRGVGKKDPHEFDWRADYDANLRNAWNVGWNACVDAMEREAKE